MKTVPNKEDLFKAYIALQDRGRAEQVPFLMHHRTINYTCIKETIG